MNEAIQDSMANLITSIRLKQAILIKNLLNDLFLSEHFWLISHKSGFILPAFVTY